MMLTFKILVISTDLLIKYITLAFHGGIRWCIVDNCRDGCPLGRSTETGIKHFEV